MANAVQASSTSRNQRREWRGIAVFLAGGLLSFIPALAPDAHAAATEDPVRTELFADVSAVAAGQPFKVGVLFHIAPEWHIYWKYPGDAGLPTSVTFELPKGFVASELEWPLPQSFTQPGDVVGYGYTESVMLMANVTPPKNLPAGTEFPIRAKVQWLSCRNVCRPGRAELNAKLAAAPQPAPADEKLFKEWTTRLPRQWTAADDLRAVAVASDQLPSNGGAKFSIALDWKKPPSKVECFPAPTEALITDRPSVNTSGNRTEIVITVRRSGVPAGGAGVGTADQLECLVEFTLSDGKPAGFPVSLQLPAGNAARSKP